MAEDNGSAPSGRTLPYDETAERALLGAMLLSTDALELGLGLVDDGYFYIPRHGHVFYAMRRLVEISEDVDPVTVAAELRSCGLLDEVGGPGYLVDLESACVATTSASSYAAIVERHFRQRKMIGLAYEVAEQARTGVEWHESLGRVLELGSTNGVVHSPSTLDLVDLGPIVAGDVVEERPLWLRRSDGTGLLYPGRVHDLHSPPSVGKTWVALAAVRDVLGAGGNALFLDYEDTGPNAVTRLRAIGTPDDLIADPTRFRYANPSGALGLAERAHLDRVVADLEPDLVILDGVAAALARNGYDENSNTDVNAWSETAVRPLADAGAAVLLLDHVVKHAEHRARGARGAGAKLALITGASYELKLSRAYSRDRAGSGRLVVAKDRIGHVGGIGEVAAEIAFRPHDGGRTLDVILSTSDPDAPHRLTGLMEQISRRLEQGHGPMSTAALIGGFRSEKRHLEKALADLTADGHVRFLDEPGATPVYTLVERYREPEADESVPVRPPGPDSTNGRTEDRADNNDEPEQTAAFDPGDF